MNIIVYTPVVSLAARWAGVLGGKYSIFQADNLAELGTLLENIQFELLLLHDRELSLEKVAVLRQRFPASKVFILSDRPDEKKGIAFLQQGVAGFGNSYMAEPRLMAAVEVVVSGSVWMNQNLMQRLITFLQKSDTAPAQVSPGDKEREGALAILSNREFQIAQLVAQGLSNLEIAGSLGITERTVKAHMSAIFSKVGVRGRLSLALLVNNIGGKG